MRKLLVLNVTLAMINTVSQCHTILKPRGEKSPVQLRSQQYGKSVKTTGLRQRCTSTPVCNDISVLAAICSHYKLSLTEENAV